jgi:hypothetical protein
VLARNTTQFVELYETTVLESLKERGFTSVLVRPRKTNQEGCTYAPPPY